MIICLYSRACEPFVAAVVAGLRQDDPVRSKVFPLAVEAAAEHPHRWRTVEQVYVLPFDVPRRFASQGPESRMRLLRQLFPGAEIANDIAVHERCRDPLASANLLLARGVSIPETMITDRPEEVRAFVAEHEYAIWKTTPAGGGFGPFIALVDDAGNLVTETGMKRYLLELRPGVDRARLDHGVLTLPAPYYFQRLVADVDRRGTMRPAQALRAYVVDGEIAFWIERYRGHCRRPSDFVIGGMRGGKQRFLRDASEEACKIARRAAEAMGVRIGVVDLVRAGSSGPYVLGAATDGPDTIIDREFKLLPEYRPVFDFDRYVAESLVAGTAEPPSAAS